MDMVSMGLLAAMGALATIAGTSEDLESDVGSQSNPNSQVQLAAQVGHTHRIYNKAISGEPPSNALYAALAAVTASVLMSDVYGMNAFFSIAVGALVAAVFNGILSMTSYMGRNASQARFDQYIYLDVLRSHTTTIMAHAYITAFCVVAISYIMTAPWLPIQHPFPLPVIAFIWGLALGAIGSSTGDVHYGAERQFQQYPFGAGLNAANSGDIVTKGEAGLRSSIDNAWFCAKFGGPVTGLAFGLIVFLDNWRTTVFDPATQGWYAVLIGILIVILLNIGNRLLEIRAKKMYGPYPEYAGEIKA
ncbi:tetrahydromethanopterin S-methyltransferase subunit E [Candidatus Methanocrinis natronophilus]|uniref:Tetrahydromethanopterin S-methyltransferase subunit E n=1 Tax=Candidatus Methanocrinis natronophilus TaxID=3033396 RepID=A0ABT5X921_9EURY|nr:tetrahydromethanopterin S-methyltransferase subunit E [Candidatus Methanocrinis natronophilus]MDF0591198.1 tetrahydromethanopterin S-methyltransferase subunit E [Candidatus Methanocrinis natronophilus]